MPLVLCLTLGPECKRCPSIPCQRINHRHVKASSDISSRLFAIHQAVDFPDCSLHQSMSPGCLSLFRAPPKMWLSSWFPLHPHPKSTHQPRHFPKPKPSSLCRVAGSKIRGFTQVTESTWFTFASLPAQRPQKELS